jgi:hypothetical protein
MRVDRAVAAVVVAVLCVVGLAAVAEAQSPIPIRYRVTRSAAGQETIAVVFSKASAVCGLPKGGQSQGSIRFDDPSLNTFDCERVDAAFFVGMVPEVAYTFTIAGQANDLDRYGDESIAVVIALPRVPQIPGAPTNPRVVPPGAVGVAVLGVVSVNPYKWAGLEVAPVTLDGGAGEVFLGAKALEVPGYPVKRGDRVSLMLWRER